MSSIDRKGPCPCGSGKKYKKCCAWKDATARAAVNPPAPAEPDFIAEIMPDVDAEVDRLLERLERGEDRSVRTRLMSLYQKYPGYHMTNYVMGVYASVVEDDSITAIPYFEKVVRVLPVFAEAHYNLGCAFMKLCRIGPAVAAFRKAIQYSSGKGGIAKVAKDRITALERALSKDSAFTTLDAYIQNENLFSLAFENLTKQRYGEAAAMFDQALKHDPNHVQTHGNLALCLAGLGRKAAALASLDRALELDPTYEPARINEQALKQ